MKILMVFTLVISNIVAHILFKMASADLKSFDVVNLLTNYKLLVGALLQLVALLVWVKLLQNVALYWAGLMAAMIPLGLVLAGRLIFNEQISTYQLLGAALIVIGLFFVNIQRV